MSLCGLSITDKILFFQANLLYLDRLQKEDMENLVKKRETEVSLMKDVAKANEVSLYYTVPLLKCYYKFSKEVGL